MSSRITAAELADRLARAEALYDLGNFSDAENIYRALLADNAQCAEALFALSQLLQQRARLAEALAVVQQLLQNHPAHLQGLLLLAEVYVALNRPRDALSIYQQVVQQDSRCSAAYLGAALLLRRGGQIGMALQALSQALSLEPDLPEARKHMAAMLGELAPREYQPQLATDLAACYAAEEVDQQQLAFLTADQLLFKYERPDGTLPHEQSVPALLAAMNADTLLLDFLSKSINVHPRMEKLLTNIRRWLLSRFATGFDSAYPLPESLLAAMGLQCFANEYIYPVAEQEQPQLDALLQRLDVSESGSRVIESELLLGATYAPLGQTLPNVDFIAEGFLQKKLVKLSVINIRDEQRLRQQIRTIAPASNVVSQKVQAQYEENPYPRWQAPPAPRLLPMKQWLQRLPGFQQQDVFPDNLSVLVAGCGTGFEPLDMARMDPSLTITAVDLSKSSLAYATRMAQQLGVTQVEFLQGDILALSQLDQRFDVVTSTGVLHHMEDPAAGWRSIAAVTKPGGVMRISLYSELARRRIVHARALIAQWGSASCASAIKQFRAEIIAGQHGSELAELAGSDDMYSLSACRDLLFHVQEHRFSFTQIAALLDELGLTFIGLDLPAATVREQFTRMFPEPDALLDLHKWQLFEERYPDSFAAMYQFWCQKL